MAHAKKRQRLDAAAQQYAAFSAAAALNDVATAWRHLEFAHVLTQPYVWPHVANHLKMFSYAFITRNWAEWVAQIPRLLLAGPGSFTGRAPLGNPGTRRVGIFEPAQLPTELQPLLQ